MINILKRIGRITLGFLLVPVTFAEILFYLIKWVFTGESFLARLPLMLCAFFADAPFTFLRDNTKEYGYES